MTAQEPPKFDAEFREKLHDLFVWRRDVRQFKTDPIDPDQLHRLLSLAALAPSVGNAQPWRFALVETPSLRAQIRDSFARANADALGGYDGDQAQAYAALKLEGIDKAPVQIAVFVEHDTPVGHGLGRKTMPETLAYSVVGAIQHLWLAARAEGLGLGWVSILEPELVTRLLDVPDQWSLVAYLCLGRPEACEVKAEPTLVKTGWQNRIDVGRFIVKR